MAAEATREAHMAKEGTTEQAATDLFDELERDFARAGADMHPFAFPACVLLATILGLVVLSVGH